MNYLTLLRIEKILAEAESQLESAGPGGSELEAIFSPAHIRELIARPIYGAEGMEAEAFAILQRLANFANHCANIQAKPQYDY